MERKVEYKLQMDDNILHEAKKFIKENNLSLSEYIEGLIRYDLDLLEIEGLKRPGAVFDKVYTCWVTDDIMSAEQKEAILKLMNNEGDNPVFLDGVYSTLSKLGYTPIREFTDIKKREEGLG